MEGEAQPLEGLSFWRVALGCRCPRCGRGGLYEGVLKIRPVCLVCGLDLTQVDVGDGTAVPMITLLGFLLVGFALWFEMKFDPPFWAHLLIWPPIAVVLAIVMMRPFKAGLVFWQYRTRWKA